MPAIVRVDAGNPGPMTGEGNHTYLVVAEGLATLIDAGVGRPEHLMAIDRALDEHDARLTDVVVTHAHPDHAAGAPAIAARHPGVSFLKWPWPVEDQGCDVVWRPLHDGGAVPVGREDRLDVVHTPGHSPDHIALWHARSRSVFAGDLVTQGGSVMIHVSHGGSLVQYLASLERIRALAPVRLFPAHGPDVGHPEAVLAAQIAHRLQRERQVADALSAGRTTVRAIAETIYHGLPPPLMAAALENVRAHLEKLYAEGRVSRDGDDWIA